MGGRQKSYIISRFVS